MGLHSLEGIRGSAGHRLLTLEHRGVSSAHEREGKCEGDTKSQLSLFLAADGRGLGAARGGNKGPLPVELPQRGKCAALHNVKGRRRPVKQAGFTENRRIP